MSINLKNVKKSKLADRTDWTPTNRVYSDEMKRHYDQRYNLVQDWVNSDNDKSKQQIIRDLSIKYNMPESSVKKIILSSTGEKL